MIPLAKEVMYVEEIPREGIFFLAADIGGTNSNFGIFNLSSTQPILICSVHYKSKLVTDFSQLVKQVCDYIHENYQIAITRACFGAAGIIQHNRIFARPTHLTFDINLPEIAKATGIKDLFLINDFEAVALGIKLIDQKSIITAHAGNPVLHGNKAFLGAGTGLGKSTLTWTSEHRQYFPVSSEGGHADIVIYNSQELDLITFITNQLDTTCHVSWEHVVSGSGIQKIYKFLGTQKDYVQTDATREIEAQDFNPDRISYYAHEDERCKDTFELFTRFYARCAKNFVLETLALGGIYIAGGIAAKNISLFSNPIFLEEFKNCSLDRKIFLEIPVYVIADYNISLYGAVAADLLHRGHIL